MIDLKARVRQSTLISEDGQPEVNVAENKSHCFCLNKEDKLTLLKDDTSAVGV